MDYLEKAVVSLKKIYNEYKNKGLLSIYLWGSITTDEFNFEKSDVDAIGIVDNSFNVEFEELKLKLKALSPEFQEFKLNPLFLNELDGGNLQSRLSKFISPKILLLEFNNWYYVCGNKFDLNDFKLAPASFQEAISMIIYEVENEFIPQFKTQNFEKREYFCKNLMKICHYLNQLKNGMHPFSYKTLFEKSTDETKKIVDILLDIRDNGWSLTTFQEHLPILFNFLEEIKSH